MLFKICNKQRGIGLLELLLALAIIAVLIFMATRYFNAAAESQQANTVYAQFLEIQQALYHWRHTHGSTDDLKNISDLSGLVSDETAANKSPFPGTSWVIAPGQKGNVEVHLTQLPKGGVCNRLKAKFAPPLSARCEVGTGNNQLDELVVSGM